jgi:hypothetical protein
MPGSARVLVEAKIDRAEFRQRPAAELVEISTLEAKGVSWEPSGQAPELVPRVERRRRLPSRHREKRREE